MSQNPNGKAEIINEICKALTNGEKEKARDVILGKYPFTPFLLGKRNYSEYKKTKVFIRDGFIDRYTGNRLIFPPVLKLISNELPEEFPYHKNGKMDRCHFAHWELYPSIDHINPIARGGPDSEDNWVTTSMIRNSAKSNWTIEELEWEIHPPGNFEDWDGLLQWFFDFVNIKPNILEDSSIKKWHNPAKKALDEYEKGI